MFQTRPERFAELQAQIRVSHQFAQPVIHQATYKFLELLWREVRKIHELS